MICPPFTALRTVVDGVRGSAVRVAAQNMHERGRGRIHRRGLRADAAGARGVAASCSATPSAASCSARPTPRSRARFPRALAAGLLPILCVGETEEEREARRDASASCASRCRPTSRRWPTEQLADVVIAYEPIWAIGTGKTATPEQAQDAIALRARAARATATPRSRQRVRILYGGSVNAGNAAELLAQPDMDGALVGGASLDPAEFADDRRGGAASAALSTPAAVPSVALVVLDGWGIAPPGPGNAVSLADTPVFDALWAHYPHTQLEACGRGGRACPRARWATPRSAT